MAFLLFYLCLIAFSIENEPFEFRFDEIMYCYCEQTWFSEHYFVRFQENANIPVF